MNEGETTTTKMYIKFTKQAYTNFSFLCQTLRQANNSKCNSIGFIKSNYYNSKIR